MGFRFHKSFKIAPGVRFNVGTKSTSLSFGGRGMRYTVSSTGRRTTTVGLPGTGLSYSTSAGGSRRYNNTSYQRRNDLLRTQREMERAEEQERARNEVDLYENQIEIIKSLHKECDEQINWFEVVRRQAPYQKGEKGPKEIEATKKLENYKPSIIQSMLRLEGKEKNKLQEGIEQAKIEDLKDYQAWEELNKLALRVMRREPDALFEVIQEMNPFDDLVEFGSGFEFVINQPNTIEVEFEVQSDTVIPKVEKILTKTGKLSTKQMTLTKYFDLYQDYVCSCALRIARDLFALLPLEYVTIHAMDTFFDSSTGQHRKGCILSVEIDKNTLNTLNFDLIDCSDSMSNFQHNMKFLKTKGFQLVNKLGI